MPSRLHESQLVLFRNQSTLAAGLMRDALGVSLPSFQEARIDSADLTDVQPAEYRADLVIRLVSDDDPVCAIIVEVQLSADDDKRFTWPAYVSNLRARLRCPVLLLVVAADDSVAGWASRTVELGGLHYFTPYVLGPSQMPVVADEAQAHENPELAVLSAMPHGRDLDIEQAPRIALVAQRVSAGLDADRSKFYSDLILVSLGEAARQALNTMNARKYEYPSDLAQAFIDLGNAEGRAAILLRLLTCRFGPLGAEMESRIRRAEIPELDLIGERLLSARTLEEAVGNN